MSKKKTVPQPVHWQTNGTFSVKNQKLSEHTAPPVPAVSMAQFVVKLQEKISRVWISPLSAPVGLSCAVKVTLNLDGTVIKADIFSPCKENPLFKSAIEMALTKASPLPVPPESVGKEFIFAFNFEPAR